MTDQAHEEHEACTPFRIDFDRIAGQVADNETVKARTSGGRQLKSVEHTVHHLREETGLDDRQIAKVLLTTSVLFMDLLRIGRDWNPIFFANLLALCGQRLWHDALAADAPEPPPQDASKWWAVWEKDGQLREVVEFDEPRREPEVRCRLIADCDSVYMPPHWELTALTEEWAWRLRRLMRINGGQRREGAADENEPTPKPGPPDGRFWAVWNRNGTLHTVQEFAEPALGAEVLAQLTANGDTGPFELEPITESRAEELREQVRR